MPRRAAASLTPGSLGAVHSAGERRPGDICAAPGKPDAAPRFLPRGALPQGVRKLQLPLTFPKSDRLRASRFEGVRGEV